MLPLLPALLLLMIHGPGAVDSGAYSSRLPAAFWALSQGLDRQGGVERELDSIAFKSLLAIAADEALCRAICEFLSAPEPTMSVPLASLDRPAPPWPPISGQARPAFADAQRSRDGPLPR